MPADGGVRGDAILAGVAFGDGEGDAFLRGLVEREAGGRAVRAENINPIAQTTAKTRARTSSEAAIRPALSPPANQAKARNGSAVARKTIATAHAATSFPTTMSAAVSSVVCSVARTPCSRSPFIEVAVREGTMSMPSPSTQNVTTS